MAGVLQHLRSSTLNKRPNPASMVDGQVAINYASGSPGMFFKDSNGSLVKVGPVHVGSGAPNAVPASGGTAGNSLGEQWLDTSGGTYVFKIWDGAAWRSEAGEFVNVTGDTMTGALGIIAGSAGSPSLFISGDANTGLYSPGADQLAISTNGTGRLFVGSNGRVGVNTSSAPSLFVVSKAGAEGIEIEPGDTSGVNLTRHYNRSTDAFVTSSIYASNHIFYTGATEAMRLDSSGRLGLGTSSPSYTLQTSGAGGSIGHQVGTNTSTIRYTNTNTTAEWSAGTSAPALANAGDYYVISQFGTDSTWRERLRIDSSGRVGIGTTSPGTDLDVNNSGANCVIRARSGSTYSATLSLLPNGSGSGVSLAAGGDSSALLYNQLNSHLAFGTNNTERARIDSSGRFLVGTSSTSAAARVMIAGGDGSRGTLNIASTSASPADGDDLGLISFNDSTHIYNNALIRAQRDGGTWTATTSKPTRLVFSTTADGASSPTERMRITNEGVVGTFSTGNSFVFSTSQGAGTSTAFLYGRHSSTNYNDGTNTFIVWSNGNVVNTNNSYGAISDAKLKENIVDANSQWADLKALQVRKYNFKEGQTHTQIGLIAQEAELVSPGLVSESPDRDAEGNDLGTVTKSVNYSVLYMKAVKALQEAMERIETLEAKVAALEES